MLGFWTSEVEAGHPRILFPLAYASHRFCGVELSSDGHPGGAVFTWACDDGSEGDVLVAASITDLIDEMAAAVEDGDGGRMEAPEPAFDVDWEVWEGRCADRLQRNPHRTYGSVMSFPHTDPRLGLNAYRWPGVIADTWPQHWWDAR